MLYEERGRDGYQNDSPTAPVGLLRRAWQEIYGATRPVEVSGAGAYGAVSDPSGGDWHDAALAGDLLVDLVGGQGLADVYEATAELRVHVELVGDAVAAVHDGIVVLAA